MVAAEAITHVPSVAVLCWLFKHIIEANHLNLKDYPNLDISQKLHMNRDQFSDLLNFMNVKCIQ